MLKGQVLLVAPLLVLWPLFMKAPGAAARAGLGMLLSVALIGSPWLVGRGAMWTIGVALVPVLVRRASTAKRPGAVAWLTAPIGALLVVWPAVLPGNRGVAAVVALSVLAVALVALARRAGRGWLGPLVALGATAALALDAALFGGSVAWLKVGLFYGQSKFQEMSVGAANLPALLETFLGVHAKSPVWTIDLPALAIHAKVTVKGVLVGGYVAALGVSAGCAAVYAKRRDPRVLIALTLPWVVLFALLTQMHERYLVWGACLGAVWAAAGSAATATNLLVSVLAFLNIAWSMNAAAPRSLPTLAPLLGAVAPWLPWLMLGVAGLAVWQTVGPAVRGGRTRPATAEGDAVADAPSAPLPLAG
jgi:hypothetical protein